MTDRALIIAVETYDQVTDGFTATKLDGTLAAAIDFRDWLREKWAREGTAGTVYFCSSPQLPGERAATKDALVDALIDLEQQGTNSTDNLYVYFSGHGFRLAKDTAKLSDVLVAADFVNTQRSADCCLKLDALVDGLRGSLGHGRHFYFIDACRNEVSKAIAGSLIPFNMEGGEEPSVFVLQSTVAGAPSLVAGPFSKKLREGLRGAGKAKVWEPPITDSMKVRFDSLRRYLRDALKDTQPITQSTSGELGETDVVLAVISPVTPVKLTIAVPDTGQPVSGEATVTPFDGAAVTHRITAAVTVIELPPRHYTVAVALDRAALDPEEMKVEAYEDVVLTFKSASRGRSAQRAPAAPPAVEVVVPEGAAVRLLHAATGAALSESLGVSVVDPDLHIRLSVIGAARILGSVGASSRFAGLPLATFGNQAPGASPVYVLAGLPSADVTLQVGIGQAQGAVTWVEAAGKGLGGVREALVPASPGQQFVTVGIGEQPGHTIASLASPNRATLIIVSLDEDGQRRVSQYLLPIGHLRGQLDDEVQRGIEFRNPLKDVYALAQLIRAFGKRRRIAREFKNAELDELLFAKWLDPIGASLAAYELVRRRTSGDRPPEQLDVVAANLTRFFPELPDSAAIARLARRDRTPRTGVPLFLDGLRAFPDYPDWLPFPAGLLDFGGPWTAWRDAVPVPRGRSRRSPSRTR